jgi:hypothetical protein
VTSEDRRTYQRDYARRKREERLAAQMKSATRCPKRQGPTTCGGPIRTEIDRLGRTVLVCEWCERQKRGVCRDCSRPVRGAIRRARYCEEHFEASRQRSIKASEDRHHDERLKRSRAYYRDNEEVRQRRIEYKRAWRKANPEKVKAQKKRYVDRQRPDPNSQYNRYHAKYRKKYRHQKRALERDRLRITPPEKKASPECTKCGKATRWTPVPYGKSGRPWTVCSACLHPCERAIRRKNRRRQLVRAREYFDAIPRKVKRPREATRGPGWERLCFTPGCEIVVTHRKKKCTKCRARDRELAAARLADHRGRGRRTDLENVA